MGIEQGNYIEKKDEREVAVQELLELGLEATDRNIAVVLEEQKTRQHPEGYDEVLDAVNDPVALARVMKERKITHLVHGEGRTVWDHTKLSLQKVNESDYTDEEKQELRMILLYHDIGKTVVAERKINKDKTQENLEKGKLCQSMIGHQNQLKLDIRNGFKENGVRGERVLDAYIRVITNHMNIHLTDMKDVKLAELIDGFGEDVETREEVVRVLLRVIQFDSAASRSIKLEGDEVREEVREQPTFGDIWHRYAAFRGLLET